jgi:cell division protein FtsI (penicillin-binding protein 3)
MHATFAQMLKAYSAFNNDGIAVTPRLVNYLEDAKGRHYTLAPSVGDIQPISKKTANQMHNILLEVVKRGTGVKAQYPGLEIGGKTGTAHIVKNRRYVREYHSSFYGFANDEFGHKYTIGVLVIRAKKKYKYFASQSAVPTFKNIVRILVEQGKLTPDPEVLKKIEEENMYVQEQQLAQETAEAPEKPKKRVKKKVIEPKVLKEPELPTNQPAPEHIQKFENIEDLF